MVERGGPSWTRRWGVKSSAPRVHGFQTCRSFMTSAHNSPTEPIGIHYSRMIGEVSILSADTSRTFGNGEKQCSRVGERVKIYYYLLIVIDCGVSPLT